MSKTKLKNPASDTGISYKTTLSAAIAAAVGASPALAQNSASIEEIKVTASKRGEMSLQDFAGSIQAFSAEQLRNQGLFNMEDYSKFTPSMTYFGSTPGSGRVFFRGIADAPDAFIAASSAAVYIDDQPITQSKQADPRLIDIERVEALSGPQGTLYGSSSQSGTLRIVTNKPDPTEFSSFADVSLKTMEEGDASYDIAGMVNIPLVEDKFALRLVGFSATEGGFIDNVLGTTPSAEVGKVSVNGPQFNSDVVEENWNKVTTTGGRAAAKWFINDDWSATVMANFQSMDADADNAYDSTVGDLQLIAFYPDTRTDDWQQYSLTLEGNIGFANFTSATSYFTRDSFYSQDTTAYTAYFGTFCYYALVSYNIYCFQPAGGYYYHADPIGFLTNDQQNTSFTQEFRLSGSTDRFSWVTGVFYEKREEDWDFYTYQTNEGGYRASQGFDNWVNAWGVPAQPTDAWWYSADRTEWTSKAVFGEGTFDLTDKLSVTLGARWFEVEQDKTYFVELPAGRRTPALADLSGNGVDKHGCLLADGPCNAGDTDNPNDIGITTPNSKEDDTAFKFSVQYAFNDDANMYALFSEGFRPGGTNRNRGAPALPPQYGSDFLTNYEFGLRTTWSDGRVQANLTAFFQEWENYQLEVVDPSNKPCTEVAPPCGQPWQKGIFNAGNAKSDGVELHLEARPSDGLSLRANATWLDATVEEESALVPDIRKGARLPFAPEFKGSFYMQYNWPTSFFGSDESFVQLQFTHVGSSLNQVQEIPLMDGGFWTNTPQLTMKSYQTTGLKFGVTGEDWEANLFINNAGDERGQIYHDVTDFDHFWGGHMRTSVIRPREIGIRFYKSWN